MWGENQRARFRDAKTDQRIFLFFFYKAINERGEDRRKRRGVFRFMSLLVRGSEKGLIMCWVTARGGGNCMR